MHGCTVDSVKQFYFDVVDDVDISISADVDKLG